MYKPMSSTHGGWAGPALPVLLRKASSVGRKADPTDGVKPAFNLVLLLVTRLTKTRPVLRDLASVSTLVRNMPLSAHLGERPHAQRVQVNRSRGRGTVADVDSRTGLVRAQTTALPGTRHRNRNGHGHPSRFRYHPDLDGSPRREDSGMLERIYATRGGDNEAVTTAQCDSDARNPHHDDWTASGDGMRLGAGRRSDSPQ